MVDQAPCSYCGLPAGVQQSSDRTESTADIFCCLGCRIAAGIMQHDDETGANRWALTRLGLALFFTMNVMVFTIVLWTWNVHDLPSDSRIHAFREILRYGCLLFSGPVLILLGGPLVESSVEAFSHRRFTTDALLLLGVCAAFFYSLVSLLFGYPDVYFEVACMILVAVTLGKWLEATAKFKVTQAMRSLRQLLPETVRRVTGDTETIVDLESVQPADVVRVLAGERIPVDGVLESGVCTVDEQVITGESMPRSKCRGEVLYGGTLNLAGAVHLRATESADTGAIARLVESVQEATASQCSTIRRADRLAAWFVPLIVVACLAAFAGNFNNGIHNALMSSLSVVLIACPCALGIATPLALWVAINTASRNGVLFRDGDVVDKLAKIRSVAFDKTGTVTSGDVHLVESYYDNEVGSRVRSVAKTLADSSNHVLSKAVANNLRLKSSGDCSSERLTQVQDHPGKGIAGLLNDSVAMLGSVHFADELGMSISPRLADVIGQHPDLAVVCVGWAGQVQGVFLLGETLRTEAQEVFARLRQMDLELSILTGDHDCRAAAMQRQTSVNTIGHLLPEGKKDELAKLQRPVAMVGDGINDALALAVADVGIALDCGADVSRDVADVCLLGSSLQQLPGAIELARKTKSTITRNLVWATSYNVIGIGFAVAGMLNPIIAAVAMVGSSLFVLTNSLSLAGFGPATVARSDVHVAEQTALSDPDLDPRLDDIVDRADSGGGLPSVAAQVPPELAR